MTAPDRYSLAAAVVAMADRMAWSDRMSAHAFNRYLNDHAAGRDDQAAAAEAEHDRLDRASARQYRALRRLVDALSNLAGGPYGRDDPETGAALPPGVAGFACGGATR